MSGSRFGMVRVAAALALGLAVLLPIGSTARAEKAHGYAVQVFALVGPTCPLVRYGWDCPDALLPGVQLVLERFDGSEFRVLREFQTNPNGYASIEVPRRGFYRINVPAPPVPPGGPVPLPLQRLVSPVGFKVPAAPFDAGGQRQTPVVVHFDSGIR